MKIKKIILVLTSFNALMATKYFTLPDLVTLCKTCPENVESDNDNFDHPDFSTVLKSLRPSLFDRYFGGIKKRGKHFAITDLEKLLKEVTLQQKGKGRTGDFILATQVELEDKIVIFGTIQGAFHSLVRDLQELKRQGIIDNSLKIIDPRYLIIFNGSVVARSPYVLQTLFVILLLMKHNPDKVFYIKSDFEQEQLWINGCFTQQLDIVYRKFEKSITDLFKEFVTILPAAFYGNYAAQPEKLFKISGLKKFQYDSIENQTGDLFYSLKHGEISVWNLDKKKKSDKRAYASIFIEGFDPSIKTRAIEPLMIMGSYGAANTWRVFSGASSFYNDLYGFKDDAFATIVFGKDLNATIIELFSRNRLTQEPFALKGSFEVNTSTPQAATALNLNLSEKEIYIGSTFDLSKGNYIMGERLRTGILLAIKEANGSPEMKGKDIKDIILDDRYTARLARENIDRLKKEFSVETILLPLGTSTILAAQDLILSASILAAFPVTGSKLCRDPEMKGLINFRAPYKLEVEKLITYIIKEYKLKNFALLYQDDIYGNDCMEKAREALKAHGITQWTEIPYPVNATNFTKQLEILKNIQVEALGCFSDPQPTQEFLRQLGVVNLATVKLFAISFVVDDQFEAFVKNELGLQALYSRVVPNPKLSTLDLVVEYRNLMAELKRPYDAYSLEGYIGATILCEMIKKSSGPVTHTTLLSQLEALNNYNLKGLTLTFDSQDRQLSKRIWFDFQDGNDWQEIK